MIFLDTNVLIDVLAPGQAWREWSMERIETLGTENVLIIDQIVLAELASGFRELAEATEWLGQMGIEIRILDEIAAFTGGAAFRRYRKDRLDRSSILADFLIGAHAEQLGAALLTRDPANYRRYFPGLALIIPADDDHD